MKMANMDAVLDFIFTNPRHSDGVCSSLLASCLLLVIESLLLQFFQDYKCMYLSWV